MEYITVAFLNKPFGLQGEIRAFSMTSFAKDRFKKGKKFFAMKQGKEIIPLTLKSYRANGDSLVMRFEEISSIEQAEAIQGYDLNMDKAEAAMPEGYYRFADLIGCKAVDDNGLELGEVSAVTSFAPTKNLKIKKPDGKVFYAPFIDQFVGDIDLEAKRIVIHVVEGML